MHHGGLALDASQDLDALAQVAGQGGSKQS